MENFRIEKKKKSSYKADGSRDYPGMTIEEMRIRKTQLRYTYARIAELSGLPLGTVQKVLTGATASPRMKTLLALEKVLSAGNGDVHENREWKHGFGSASEKREGGEKAESAPSYGGSDADAPNGRTIFGNPRGPFTIVDYENLPDDLRVELIDGYFYRMEAPTSLHQELSAELFFRLKDYQKRKRADCRVFSAPFDVQLDKDKFTMIQPDLCVICDRSRIVRRGCLGAPDFVIEILSESTRAKDMYTKMAKYKFAGVREYWMVDPVRKKVMVYYYEDEDRVAVYGFEAKIPVGISGGELEIDFAEIMQDLSYLDNTGN